MRLRASSDFQFTNNGNASAVICSIMQIMKQILLRDFLRTVPDANNCRTAPLQIRKMDKLIYNIPRISSLIWVGEKESSDNACSMDRW